MNNWYKNKLIILVAAVLIIGGFFFFKNDGSSDEAAKALESDVEQGEILVMGEIACLPYKSATPGQGCVKGIQGNDGKFYALNSIAVRNAENSMEEGTNVTAIGVFQEANTSVNDSSVFRYDGVLVVRTLEAK
jgi:hypothetical protein